MEVFSMIWDMIKLCCKCSYECNAYIRDLEKNVESLSLKNRELVDTYNGVRGRVEGPKVAHGYVPRIQVLGWLESAEETISRVDTLLQRGEQEKDRLCLWGYCSMNCWSGYKVGKEVVEMTEAVRELIERGSFEVVADPPPPPVVENLLTETTVGLESRLSEVWRYIEDDRVRIIGLYGVRGVGKTTLLDQLHNKFQDTIHNFDVVISVTASTEVNIEIIQHVIRYRLDIPDDMWKDKDVRGRAAEIYGRLSQKKFAFLLDDIRGPIKLSKAGVPVQNGSKIVFTTILEEVCTTMGAEWRFKVDYLPQEDAWKLFRFTVTDDVLNSHPEILKLAETVANMCGGLPLALTTIGSSPMARSRDPDTWRHAIDELRSYPAEFPGMGNLIFPLLKFSYDSLSSTTHKTCFLYCSLFPINRSIAEDELIELWIGEGILRDSHDIAVARRQGKSVIESLKHACLLEEVEVEGFGNSIRMHDMLREMALWIALKENNKILVLEHDRLIKQQGISNWKEAVRVSLWRGSAIEFLTPTPLSCPRLLTLLLRDTETKEFSNNIFQSMHALRVLDSSHNSFLTKLPVGTGELTNLRYLNLSYTSISELPVEIMKGFTQLRMLLLDGTEQLKAIPVGLLSSLPSLQVFSWVTKVQHYFLSSIPAGVTVLLLKELESLEHIQEISIVLSTRDSIDEFKSSSNLQSRIRRLIIKFPEFHSLDIHKGGCFQNLQDLSIIKCTVKDLTFLIQVPSLRFLSVIACHSLEEIIASDQIEENSMFFNLKGVYLDDLPNLKSICRSAMAFPSLQSLYVLRCPSLRKLPFNSESAKKTIIIGKQKWWNQLQWEDEATKRVFSSKFKIRMSISQDELNRRADAFIKKFYNELRLQRLESDQRFLKMESTFSS